MRQNVVILGGGTGGTLAANRLRRMLPEAEVAISVVDQDDIHVYQPGLLFVPFGEMRPGELVRPRRRQFQEGIVFRERAVDRVDVERHRVVLESGTELPYDALLVATGATLLPQETEGLLGPAWMNEVGTFYTPEGASALRSRLEGFRGGRLVVNVIDNPIKCPVAPLEFCFLADWYLRTRGRRAAVSITYVTPLNGAFTKPVAAATLGSLLREKGIEMVTEFNTEKVLITGDDRRIRAYDGREIPFDLAVVIPLHGGAAYVGRSPGLGDELNFVPVDHQTLQSTADPSVFAIGDAASVPTSKAGSVAHFEGETVTRNIVHHLRGEPLEPTFDGHTNCFIETGFDRALMIDFNYDTEPLGGHFPGPIGLPLLQESHLNHLGKLMFEWFYWNSLLPGRDIPGLTNTMPLWGKRIPAGVQADDGGGAHGN
ncbi:MAG: type III sulfide quinone reductase, selenoprotein subtype [Candidatus Dormibacteria bacterium]